MDTWKIKETDFYQQKTAEDRIKFLLKYAILAPSTHNTQPWLFKIGTDYCEVFCDKSYELKQADAKGRDFFISLGCCIENLEIAAEYFNVLKEIKYSNLEGDLIAKVSFKDLLNKNKPKKSLEGLVNAIKKRVTVRGLFSSKQVPPTEIKNLSKLTRPFLNLHTIKEKEGVKQIARLTAYGLQLAYKRPEFRLEMSGWMNSNLSRRKEGIPGYSLRMPTPLSIVFPTLVKYFDMGSKVGRLNYMSMASSPLVCVITAKKDSRKIWLEVGRLAQRVMLQLNSQGIKTSIFVASVEMGDLYKSVQKLIKTADIPQFVFCAGYMSRTQKPTPRHHLETKILD